MMTRRKDESYRIAVGTGDGSSITEHFGQCAEWSVIEVSNDRGYFLEKRRAFPILDGHDDESIAKAIESLKDCRAVLVRKIGPVIERRLLRSGISVFESSGPIWNAVDKLIQYYNRIDGKIDKSRII
jgi:nitrogen fixation protein NifB